MMDPDNDMRLLKVPPRVVKRIAAEAYAEAVEAVKVLGNDETAQRASGKRKPDDDYYWALSDAVAVIESLGGES